MNFTLWKINNYLKKKKTLIVLNTYKMWIVLYVNYTSINEIKAKIKSKVFGVGGPWVQSLSLPCVSTM